MAKNVNSKIISTILVIIFTFSACIIPVNAQTKKVIIGGEAFGLKLYCKGVMVTSLESFKSRGEAVCPGKTAGLEKGDIITAVNLQNVKSNEKLNELIKSSKGNSLRLTVERDGKVFNTALTPKINEQGEYYAGIWIKDSCAGIGTISYYDKEKGVYGALGHGICETDSGSLMLSGSGEVLSASITSVTKSAGNTIGTLNGYFLDNTIGNIESNSANGIYGKISESPAKNMKFEIAQKDEITPGKGKIYTTVSGETAQAYDIEIVQVCNTQNNTNKNLVVKITDKELLKTTGGIVQGMSGSPIIQNGKFAGALTYVFVDDCTMGYAILADNMIR